MTNAPRHHHLTETHHKNAMLQRYRYPGALRYPLP